MTKKKEKLNIKTIFIHVLMEKKNLGSGIMKLKLFS